MFEQILSKIAKSFYQHQIPYMVIEGQALLQYGQPRLTEDIDITLGMGQEKSSDIISLIQSIGLIPFKDATPELIQETNVLPCSDKSTGIRVDFIFSFLPYEKKAIERAKKVKIGGSEVQFASAEDLIIHKMFAGRPRDLEDVKSVIIKQNKTLDLDYIKENLTEFSQLEGYQSILKDFEKLF